MIETLKLPSRVASFANRPNLSISISFYERVVLEETCRTHFMGRERKANNYCITCSHGTLVTGCHISMCPEENSLKVKIVEYFVYSEEK